MEIEMIGATVGTAFFIVGVQIIFFTKRFEDEYGDKIDVIKTIIKSNIEMMLRELFEKKYLSHIQKEGKGTWKEHSMSGAIFSEISSLEDNELSNPHELDNIVEASAKYDTWATFLVNGKKVWRQIGMVVVLFGATIVISSVVYGFTESPDIIIFATFAFLMLGTLLFNLCVIQRNNLRKIDETYMKVQEEMDI